MIPPEAYKWLPGGFSFSARAGTPMKEQGRTSSRHRKTFTARDISYIMWSMRDAKSLPIGVFDSGVGGLTVVRSIRKKLPAENIVYFGDTARVPYGNKAKCTVDRFSR
jgi:hypothetical protein